MSEIYYAPSEATIDFTVTALQVETGLSLEFVNGVWNEEEQVFEFEYGSIIEMKGKLYSADEPETGISEQNIKMMRQKEGETEWESIAVLTTEDDGTFAVSVAALETGVFTIKAVFEGGAP